jgi:hypothetical protein
MGKLVAVVALALVGLAGLPRPAEAQIVNVQASSPSRRIATASPARSS